MLSVARHQDILHYSPPISGENPFIWSDGFSFDQQTYLSDHPLYPDVSCPLWTPHDNTLGLYEPGSVTTTQRILPPSTMVTPCSFNTPFLHQSPTSDGLAHYEQSSALHDPWAYQGSAFASVQDTHALHIDHAVSPQENNIVRKPTHRPRRNRSGASRLLGSQSRYAPYLHDTSKRNTSTPTYLCQWIDDSTYLCGGAVVGTRTDTWRHLHEVHAIRLNSDKTMQSCMWETCGKRMRRESIARHILTVHLHNKVECPSCRTPFARRDSLQRHQRLCSPGDEAVSEDACTVALRT